MSLTKIIATVGPAIDSTEKIIEAINAGASVFRFNLKHSDQDWHSNCITKVKEASSITGKPVAILLDLQGPEIRVGKLKEPEIFVEKGQKIIFAQNSNLPNSNIVTIPISGNFFFGKFSAKNNFFLDDGRLEFKIIESNKDSLLAEVIREGIIKSNKNINFPGIEIPLPSLLVKDIRDLSLASKHEVDFVALSFVRNKKDIELLRKRLNNSNLTSKILAKIETRAALHNFEEILSSCDGIMIARGDLGVEIPFEEVPYYQKKIIKRCVEVGKPVITATQMLESMTSSPFPTRADVSDIANAVLDYTDAVMLSKETTIGKYPIETISTMERICSFWEEKRPPVENFHFELNHQTDAVAYSAYNLWMSSFCQKENVKAFVVLTKTGMTATSLSRLRPNLPILALTSEKEIAHQLCLSYGVTPMIYENDLYKKRDSEDIEKILTYIKEKGFVKSKEKVIILYAEDWGTPSKTNIVRIQEIP
jgi:pyruvate kinase